METLTNLKEAMEKRQISRYKLSKLTGFDESQISRWFNGEVEPSISKVEKMAEAVGIRIKLVNIK